MKKLVSDHKTRTAVPALGNLPLNAREWVKSPMARKIEGPVDPFKKIGLDLPKLPLFAD